MYYPCILYSFSCLSTETELDCGGGLGTEAHTATQRRPRMGCATRRTSTKEAVNNSPHYPATPISTSRHQLTVEQHYNDVILVILTHNARIHPLNPSGFTRSICPEAVYNTRVEGWSVSGTSVQHFAQPLHRA